MTVEPDDVDDDSDGRSATPTRADHGDDDDSGPGGGGGDDDSSGHGGDDDDDSGHGGGDDDEAARPHQAPGHDGPAPRCASGSRPRSRC